MKQPNPPGTPIDMGRMRSWVTEFSGYRVNVNEGRIERWLNQFQEGDRDLAARLLDVVDFISNDQISTALRDSLNALPGWSRRATERIGNWTFVAFSGSAGESGDQMIHRFRTANNLGGKEWNGFFRYRSELLEVAPGPDDSVVLVDDFAGTGDQAITAWEEVYNELLPYNPNIYLILVAASHSARDRIQSKTDMTPQCQYILTERDNIFSDRCDRFNDEEKDTLLQYCGTADPSNPEGYGNCGFVIVLTHKCPNNTIPVLHARRREWEGLFRRHD